MSQFAYLVRCGDGSLYAGYSPDPLARLSAHRAGKGARYTRGRGPLTLAFAQAMPSKGMALRREAALKKLSRAQKLALCDGWKNERLSLARAEDGPTIRQLYGWYVEHSAATFAASLPGEAEYTRWVTDSAADYPFLLLKDRAGKLLGFACAHRWKEREAFAWDVETTIYLAHDAAGSGRGRRLYGALLALLELQGVHNAYALVTIPNPASEGLHRAMGFVLQGTQPDTGYKNGSWYGLGTWGLALRPADGEPAPVVPFPQLDAAAVRQVLSLG